MDLNMVQCAVFANVAVRTVMKWVDAGMIPAFLESHNVAVPEELRRMCQ